jgi:hypothetical protein
MMMMMMSDGSFVNSTKKTTLFEKICNWLKQLEEVFHVHPPSLPFVGPYNQDVLVVALSSLLALD